MTAHELHRDAFDIPGLREVPADDGDRPPDAQPMAQRLPRRKTVIDDGMSPELVADAGVSEQGERLVHVFGQVAEADDVAEGLDRVEDAVGAAECLSFISPIVQMRRAFLSACAPASPIGSSGTPISSIALDTSSMIPAASSVTDL